MDRYKTSIDRVNAAQTPIYINKVLFVGTIWMTKEWFIALFSAFKPRAAMSTGGGWSSRKTHNDKDEPGVLLL